MTDTVPPWLATMRAISGTKEYAGGADNPAILQWARFIGETFPEMRGYCAQYTHDSIAWCGLTVAYCMARSGIRPVFGASDVEKFLWAAAWAKFGTRLAEPKPGCVMVLTRAGGGHVTLLEAIEGDTFLCRGGNQADMVNVARYHKSKLAAAVWPSQDGRPTTDDGEPIRPPSSVLRRRDQRVCALRRAMAEAIVDFEARRDSQGRLAVYRLPAGDGGGSYEVAGINDRYHPAAASHLADLIRAGKHDDAESYVADFLVRFTDIVRDWSPDQVRGFDAGVEFYLRDCCFNRGPKGAARILQRAAGVPDDGEIGPQTRAATGGKTPEQLLVALRAAREQYERDVAHRDESSKFWRGLVSRWDKALALARKFSAEAAAPGKPAARVKTLGWGAGIVAAIGAAAHWIDGHPLLTIGAVVIAMLVVLVVISSMKGGD